jgi:hypothetical protein
VRNLNLSFEEAMQSEPSPRAASSAAAVASAAAAAAPAIVAAVSYDGSESMNRSKEVSVDEMSLDEADSSGVEIKNDGKGSETVFISVDSNDIQPDHIRASDLLGMNRPVSPDGSVADLLSLDGSLYLDEDSIRDDKSRGDAASIAARTAYTETPDDEPGRIEAGVRPPPPAASPLSIYGFAQSSSQGRRAKSTPIKDRFSRASEKGPIATGTQKRSADRVRPIVADRVLSSHTGGPRRPRAGLFTRQHSGPTPVSVKDNNELNSVPPPVNQEGYVQEREGRAAYSPTRATQKQTEVDVKKAESVRRTGSAPRVGRDKSGHSSSEKKTASQPESVWSSFLNELSRVEHQFFNPTIASKDPPPPPP